VSYTRRRDERGASLVFVLVFLCLFGLAVPALLNFGGVNSELSSTTRARLANRYAADGGVDYGIQSLRSNDTYCTIKSGSQTTLPAVTIDGTSAQVTCQTIQGGSASGYALVATGYGLSAASLNAAISTSGSTGNASDQITIDGPAFSAGKFSFSGGTPTLKFTRDLHQYDYTSPNNWCTQDKASAVSSSNPVVAGTWTCENSGTFAVPDPNPTPVVPTAAAPAATTNVTCGDSVGGTNVGTILYPGKYTSAPTFSSNNRYYLASGVYYFAGTGSIALKGSIFGGQPAAGDTQTISSSLATPCVGDSTANTYRPGVATGTGVEIILGGNSALNVSNTSKDLMEFFTPTGQAGTNGVSLYAMTSSGTLPSNYTASSTASPLVFNGTNGGFTAHGLLYTPWQDMTIWARNAATGAGAQAGGGLVARKIAISVNSGSGTGALSASTFATRYVVVRATAGSVTRVAVVKITPNTNATTVIQSWRET